MFYIVESSKSFAEVIFDLEPVVQRLGFVVLHHHDLGEILHRRNIELDEDCAVFDICNYRLLEQLLTTDITAGLTLPWRISVFTENGATKIGLIRPLPLLADRNDQPQLARISREMEEKMILIVDETR